MQAFDITIVGGCGRVGLPLGLSFAARNLRVALFDTDATAVAAVTAGHMPFSEPGAEEVLGRVHAAGMLQATTDRAAVSRADSVVVTIGTPIDDHFQPDIVGFTGAIEGLLDVLVAGQLLVLRSTVAPGVTAMVEEIVAGADVDVAFCPERMAEGTAMVELSNFPQIVSARDPRVLERASDLFRQLTPDLVPLVPEEAELAKLFSNAWRYTTFAVANEFFTLANDRGLDYERIRRAAVHEYPRAAALPSAGFTGGPCLLKDTAQLAAAGEFGLGRASIAVNEGLPGYVVSCIERETDLSGATVGILGMAFKGESDDVRASPSYELRRILLTRARRVLCTDPFVTVDPDLLPLDEVCRQSDLLVIGAPHRVYAGLATDTPIIDIWGLRGGGVRV